MSAAVIAYQWMRHKLGTGTAVEFNRATDQTDTATSEDVGKAFKMMVTYTAYALLLLSEVPLESRLADLKATHRQQSLLRWVPSKTRGPGHMTENCWGLD